MRALAWLMFSAPLWAQNQPEQRQMEMMRARVSEEAEAFQKLAPQVLGQEKLYQRAQKPPHRFRPRIGDAAKGPPPAEWNERHLVSEYGFASLGPGGSEGVHELRQVVSVDGKEVKNTKKAQEELARVITANDDARKKETLKQFEKYGLVGAVTDFGQVLLLFTRREMERYEFTPKGTMMIGYDRALIFNY